MEFPIWVSGVTWHTDVQFFSGTKGLVHIIILFQAMMIFLLILWPRLKIHGLNSDKSTHTRSIPSPGLKDWITQKKRHLTTAPYYKFRDKLLLIIEPLTRILFYSTFIVLLSYIFLWPYVLAVFVIRLITQIIVFYLVQKKLNEPGLLAYSLFFDIFSPVINSIVFLSNTRSKSGKNKWK